MKRLERTKVEKKIKNISFLLLSAFTRLTILLMMMRRDIKVHFRNLLNSETSSVDELSIHGVQEGVDELEIELSRR